MLSSFLFNFCLFSLICMFYLSTYKAGGASGYLALTTDAGVTWTGVSPFTSTVVIRYHSIRMRSSTEAYVAGSDGRIYATFNAGTTWTLLASTGVVLNSLDVFSETQGTAGAVAGSQLYTIVSGTVCLVNYQDNIFFHLVTTRFCCPFSQRQRVSRQDNRRDSPLLSPPDSPLPNPPVNRRDSRPVSPLVSPRPSRRDSLQLTLQANLPCSPQDGPRFSLRFSLRRDPAPSPPLSLPRSRLVHRHRNHPDSLRASLRANQCCIRQVVRQPSPPRCLLGSPRCSPRRFLRPNQLVHPPARLPRSPAPCPQRSPR